jgi:hypothetical protein
MELASLTAIKRRNRTVIAPYARPDFTGLTFVFAYNKAVRRQIALIEIPHLLSS